jgi:hypothetical protein
MIAAQSSGLGGTGYQPVAAGNLPAALSCIYLIPPFLIFPFSFLIAITSVMENRKPKQGNASVFRYPPGLNPKNASSTIHALSQTLVTAPFLQSKIKNLKSKTIEIYPLKHANLPQFLF